jgi:hypothetical protein
MITLILLFAMQAQPQPQAQPRPQGQPPSAVSPPAPQRQVPGRITSDPLVGLTPDQRKQLAPYLGPPGPQAAKAVEMNKEKITAIVGPQKYQQILEWEQGPKTQAPTPPAKK